MRLRKLSMRDSEKAMMEVGWLVWGYFFGLGLFECWRET
jgi:hypothetical protein